MSMMVGFANGIAVLIVLCKLPVALRAGRSNDGCHDVSAITASCGWI